VGLAQPHGERRTKRRRRHDLWLRSHRPEGLPGHGECDHLVPEPILTATTTKHIFLPDRTLLATVVGSGTSTASTTYLHPDHLGGTNVVTDESGNVVQTLDYYPYGSQRIATGSHSEQRRFIGEEYDGDTEFSYLNARYYQGSRGQFMSQDPAHTAIGSLGFRQKYGRSLQSHLSNPQHLNSYSYAANNPLILIDQTGELVIETGLGLMLISSWALFNYNAVQKQIAESELETMRAYSPTVYSPEQVSAAQAAHERSGLISAATSLVFDVGGLASPTLGWTGIGIGYAGVASDALEEYLEYDPDGRRLFGKNMLFVTTPQTISGTGAGSAITAGGMMQTSGQSAVRGISPKGTSPAGVSGSSGDVWAVLRAAISQYYAEGGN
jgi:RHS repeat-associated protein